MKTTLIVAAIFLSSGVPAMGQDAAPPTPAVSPHAVALAQVVESYQLAQPGSKAENGWTELSWYLGQFDGMQRLYVAQHPDAFTEEERKGPGVFLDSFHAVRAGGADDHERKLERSGREFVAQLENLGFFGWLDRLPTMQRFVASPIVRGDAMATSPQLGSSRSLASCCAARMHILAEKADWPQYLQTFENALAIGRGLNGRCTLMHHLVSEMDQAMVFSEVKTALIAGKISPEVAKNLLAAIDRQPLPNYAFGLEGERARGLQQIDEFYDEVEAAASKKITKDLEPVIGSRKDDAKIWNDYFDGWAKVCAEDPKAAAQGSKDIDRVQSALDSPEGKSRYALVGNLIPTIDLTKPRRFEAMRDGLRIMLALEVWCSQHAGYPEKLDVLAPAVLAAIPKDPFDRSQTLRYRRDGDAKYVLYSVGSDGTDDGGKLCPQGNVNAGARGTTGTGFDFILNIAEP